VFEIKKLKNDEYGIDYLLICSLIIGFIILTTGLFISLGLYLKKKKKLAIVPIIIAILIIASLGFYAYYDRFIRPNDLEYELKIQTNITGQYTLYVPYLDNSNLKSNLEVIKGNAEIDFITIYNPETMRNIKTLQVNGTNSLTVYGEAQDDDIYPLSQHGRPDLYWILCNKTNPNQNISISLMAINNYRSGSTSWRTERLGDSRSIYLDEGWNIIEIDRTKVSA
jgi:hypothetical protein